MTLAAEIGALLAETLALLSGIGLASTSTLTRGASALTVRAIDATNEVGAFAPDSASQGALGGSFTNVSRRRLFTAPRDVDGVALAFVPAVGDTATWNGATCAILGVTPVQPGSDVLGYLVDIEA